MNWACLSIFMILRTGAGVLNELDHHYLNELEAFSQLNPTAENLARYVYEKLEQLPLFASGDVFLTQVKVWESLHSAVAYTKARSKLMGGASLCVYY